MKIVQRAVIVVTDKNLPVSKWLVRKSSFRQLMKRDTRTLIRIVKKLEQNGQMTEPGSYRIDYTAEDCFDAYRLTTED